MATLEKWSLSLILGAKTEEALLPLLPQSPPSQPQSPSLVSVDNESKPQGEQSPTCVPGDFVYEGSDIWLKHEIKKKGNKEMGRQKIQIRVFPERCYFFYVNNYVFKILKGKMVGWHHLLDGHEPGQTSGDGQGQGSLACCCPWGREEEDPTWQLNINNNSRISVFFLLLPPRAQSLKDPCVEQPTGSAFPPRCIAVPGTGVCPSAVSWGPHSCTDPHPPQALGSLLFTALGSLLPSWTGLQRSKPRGFKRIV